MGVYVNAPALGVVEGSLFNRDDVGVSVVFDQIGYDLVAGDHSRVVRRLVGQVALESVAAAE